MHKKHKTPKRSKKSTKSASSDPSATKHGKIFIVYLNDPDRNRNADLIKLTDKLAKKRDMNRSELVSQEVIKILQKAKLL
jgi:hypothetical protein